MDWKLKIPKILNLYWGNNKPLSFLRYLTVFSFNKYNPDWDIRVYYPETISRDETWITKEQKNEKYEGNDFFGELADIQKVSLIKYDISALGFPNSMPEVHKSDILRLKLLSDGGFWSDFDIFYFKPMESSILNTEKFINSEVLLCTHNASHSIGFLGGSENNDAFKYLLSKTSIRYRKNKYQCVGSSLFKEFSHNVPSIVGNIPKSLVYPIDWNETNKLLTKEELLIDESIGIHWFGGSTIASTIENSITSLEGLSETEIESTFINIIKEHTLVPKSNMPILGQQIDQ